jgi:chorismate-pyruvate lyase
MSYTGISDIDAACEELILELLGTTGSTSKMLEDIFGQKLRVEVILQERVMENGGLMLRRTSRLFLKSPELSLMYCISTFPVEGLQDNELRDLEEGVKPIGIIFGVNNIYKTGISVEQSEDPAAVEWLNLSRQKLFHKEFTIHVPGRKIGVITEIFNKESILRIWS